MQLLDDYNKARDAVFNYFGYTEDWRVLPLDDCRDFYWELDGLGPGTVCFAESEVELATGDGNYYESGIYSHRHLPKWVYRGKDFTMVCVDTHTDGNKLLAVYDNAKESIESDGRALDAHIPTPPQ